jgi:hypothetical protein
LQLSEQGLTDTAMFWSLVMVQPSGPLQETDSH